VTFLDPRNLDDWYTEFRLPSVNRLQVLANWLYEDNFFVQRAARRADGHFVPAFFLKQKTKNKYRLTREPEFLPTPVSIPESAQKADRPTVCFISRWDRRKRPEIFFELVKAFPEVRFLAAGQSRDTDWDHYLREKYGGLPNLEMLGFIDQFKEGPENRGNKLWQIFSESWVLVNTAAREGLPNALKEAAAHGCAILSSVDPDGFASRFGYHAEKDDFIQGLKILLQGDNWRERGAQGREYVTQMFEVGKAIDQHVRVYENLTGQSILGHKAPGVESI